MRIPSLPPILPPPALQWSIAASTAAAISYADRGTCAIAASSLLEELHWSESQLGEVQSAFFVGYALTQVLGGVLGGATTADDNSGGRTHVPVGGEGEKSSTNDFITPSSRRGYRTILPLSLFFTGLTTLAFPLAATLGGPTWASADRFCLGLLEGLLLPAAMAGVSDTTSNNNNDNKTNKVSFPENSVLGSDDNNKATASSIVIAGCYLGSAWAYLSAWILFSEQFQLQLANNWGYDGSVWPLVFYVNGIISMICLVVFRNEFDFTLSLGSRFRSQPNAIIETNKNNRQNIAFASTQSNLWDDTVNIAKETLSSKSGRAILAAQIGQGALLYTIASWGPLYLERINNAHSAAGLIDAVDAASSSTSPTFVSKPSSPVSPVTTAASKAASSLVFPQLTQALVGISIGATADQFSAKIGTRFTRRILQILSGVGPAIVLLYLATAHGDVADVASISVSDGTAETSMLSPPALFGAAQTISALSLGAVSVSHLDIATPSTAGAVYALGNVAAAASGSLMVNLLGRWLERESGASGISSEIIGGGREFDVPFRVVGLLSAVGSLLYGCTVETELEIGVNRTRIDE